MNNVFLVKISKRIRELKHCMAGLLFSDLALPLVVLVKVSLFCIIKKKVDLVTIHDIIVKPNENIST